MTRGCSSTLWYTTGALFSASHLSLVVLQASDGCVAEDLLQADGRHRQWHVVYIFMIWIYHVMHVTTSMCAAQVASDQILRPLGAFATPEAEQQYPPTLAGAFVQAELEAIRLKAS